MRNTSFELLRIVSMSMIVIVHFILKGVGLEDNYIGYIPLMLSSFVAIGVNCFVLISGYFSIQLRLKSLLNFYLLCVFYNVLNVFVNGTPTALSIINGFFISKTINWFFPCYFVLMILSPILNSYISNSSLKQLRIILLLLLFVDSISGWILLNPNIKGGGIIHMIILYLLAGLIRRDNIFKMFKVRHCLLIYVLSSILISICGHIIATMSTLPYVHVLGYNNPLMIISSVSFFLCFTKISLSNRFLNNIAKSVVAMLFIQDIFAYKIYSNVYNSFNVGNIDLLICCSFIYCIIFISAYIIENIRINIASNIINKVQNYINEYK